MPYLERIARNVSRASASAFSNPSVHADPIGHQGPTRQMLENEVWEKMKTLPRNLHALTVFGVMNRFMALEKQPITPEHYDILRKNLIAENQGVLKTLWAENPEVMKSTGNGPVYLAGKYIVHTPIAQIEQARSEYCSK